jgi:hypothetical protein
MAKIFNPPSSIIQPEFDWKNIDAFYSAQEKYISDLKDFCLKRKKGKDVGEVIKFQVADGYAEYMIASLRPLELIHIPVADAYKFPYIERLTEADIVQKLDFQNKLKKLFNSNK